MAELAREIERVVTAPYAPALQDLQNVVERSAPSALCAWAVSKPCQVAPLADVLLSALSYSSAALPLLGAFASVSAVRKVLLQRQPVLLDQLLQRAIDNGDSQCFHASTALLSLPLPEGTVLPARLAPFIMKLVQQMVQRPCADTIRPLYRVVGSSFSLLDAVPEETMAGFQTECTKTLRNLDDHMGSLLCLATFARIASARGQVDPLPAWLQNVRHFFGPKRGMKTLDLVVLRVVLACSASCSGLSAAETVESVRLAVEVCDTVEPEQRESWLRSNAARIAKLCEKVSRDGIDPELQMMGLAFLVSFVPASSLPKEIRVLCQRVLLSGEGRSVLRQMPDVIVKRLVDGIIPVFDESAVSDLLRYVVLTLQDSNATNPEALFSTNMALSFLSGLQRASHLGPAIGQLLASESGMLYSLLEHFPVQPRQMQCTGSAICNAAFSTSQNQLCIDLFGTFFIAFSGNPQSRSSNLPDATNLLALFMSRIKSNLARRLECSSASKPSSADLFILRTAPKTPSDNASRDWRTKMADALLQNARISHESIVQRVEEICQDLEHRCHNVEAPLRAVAEERDNLAAELEALRRRNRELEIQTEQSSQAISTLQQDITRLEKRATSATTRADELSARLAAAQKQLEDERRDSRESAHSEREKARTRELDLMATVTEREDQLEELQEEVCEKEAENEALRRTVDAMSKENAAGLETSAALKREINGLKEALETKGLLCSERDEEVKRLLAEKEYMRSEMEQLHQRAEQEVSESDRLRSALRDKEESHRSDVATLKEQHDLEMARIAAETQQQAALHKEEVKTLRIAMQAAESQASKEIQARNKKIQRLEQKVESLRNERAAKAREFSEAQEHIGRLMNVMGFKGGRSEASNEARRTSRPRSIGVPRSSGAQAEEESFYQTQQPAESFESTSFSNSGPAPKRLKNLCHSRDPSTGSGYDNYDDSTRPTAHPQGSLSAASDRERVRQPLSEADKNSPAKPQRSSSKSSSPQSTQLESQVGVILNEPNLEDLNLSFADDSIFTSTASL